MLEAYRTPRSRINDDFLNRAGTLASLSMANRPRGEFGTDQDR